MNSNTITIQSGMKLHFIGIGGIGMSGLAQMLHQAGCCVSGSDRGLARPENRPILQPLQKAGIQLFHQDGSFVQQVKPDLLIYSTAIETDNPDFIAAPAVPRLHRATALAQAMHLPNIGQMVAVSGSCGKTTVTAWLAESILRSGIDCSFLTGGLVNHWRTATAAGNYHRKGSNLFIFEADESDKTLLAYRPEYGILLNIGTDHYSKDELIRVFSAFIRQISKALVIEQSLLEQLEPHCYSHLQVKTFSLTNPHCDWYLTDYQHTSAGAVATINRDYRLSLPLPGRHNAANALAILAMFEILQLPLKKLLPQLENFAGVWRRCDYAGNLPTGAKVYDDYAHNVEKIIASISALQETTNGCLITIFQPHGFGPLKFMRHELLPALEKRLRPRDCFAMLPPYYAGGTTSFKPTSEEVITAYQQQGAGHYHYFPDRQTAASYLLNHTTDNDTVLILGARDNSLSDWAKALT